jgi:hypothetical protein
VPKTARRGTPTKSGGQGSASATSQMNCRNGDGKTSTGKGRAGACGSAVAGWSGPCWGLDHLAIYVPLLRIMCDREPQGGDRVRPVGRPLRFMYTPPDMTVPAHLDHARGRRAHPPRPPRPWHACVSRGDGQTRPRSQHSSRRSVNASRVVGADWTVVPSNRRRPGPGSTGRGPPGVLRERHQSAVPSPPPG